MEALADALESAYKRLPDAYEYAWATIDPVSGEMRVTAQELDEDSEPFSPELDVTRRPRTSAASYADLQAGDDAAPAQRSTR
ncbi:MAG: hypothetical protein R2746_18040 [Acidimicrobiales bacterium]